MTDEQRFPIMGGPSVPWSLIEPHERQAIENHDQTLARLAQRGGLAPCEAVAVLEDRKWRRMDEGEAKRRLVELIDADATRALREEIAALRARVEKAERELAEYNEQDDREAAERLERYRAVKGDADKLLKTTLGELWNRLWGPDLESLGGVVDDLLVRATQAEARAERYREALETAASELEAMHNDRVVRGAEIDTRSVAKDIRAALAATGDEEWKST